METSSHSLAAWRLGRLAAQGENTALRKIVSEVFLELRTPVYRYLLGILEPGDAEDTAQEAFLRLFTELRAGRKIDNVRAWIFQTAHNLAIDKRRRSAREEHWDETAWKRMEEELREPGPDAQHAFLERERIEGVRSALARLTPQERHAMELRAEGLRYREIAGVLGVKISSVQNYLARALGKLMRRSDAV